MNYPMKRVRNLRHFVVRRRLAQTYEESLVPSFRCTILKQILHRNWWTNTGVWCVRYWVLVWAAVIENGLV